jgi:hypothetical protein
LCIEIHTFMYECSDVISNYTAFEEWLHLHYEKCEEV